MNRHTMRNHPRASAAAIAGLVLVTLVILVATLTPAERGELGEFERCVLCGGRWMADLLRNIILFVPLGALLSLVLRGAHWYRAALLASLISALIELTQLTIAGRDPSIGDLLANTVGGFAGALAMRTRHRWAAPSRPVAARLSVGAAAVVAIIVTATGILWRPSLPVSTYFVQWTPDLEHLEPYGGRVLASSLGPWPLVPDERSGRGRFGALFDGREELVVQAEAGPQPGSLAPILAIHDQYEREILLVGPDRDDLIVRFRTSGLSVAFDQPDLRVHGAMAGAKAGERLTLRVRRAGAGDYCIAVRSETSCGNGFAAGSGWAALLFPRLRDAWMQRALDALWLGMLVLPVGLWFRRSAWSAGAFAITAMAVGVVPSLVGLRPVTLAELGGIVAGLAAGAMLARRATATLPDEGTGIRSDASSLAH